MTSYWRVACWFSFLPFLSPANSSFTPLSQASSHPFLGQHCSSSEKTALLQLKRYLSAAKPESSIPFQPSSGSLLTSWKPNTDCCSWESVNCHEVTKHVIGLNLSGHNLSGLVNSIKFLNLPYLERLNLVNCNIGEIPSFVQKLGGLVELDLSINKIHGKVPKWIWLLESLVYLNLSNNFLDGFEAPPSAPFLSSLTSLDLTSNLIEGSIPTLPISISFLSLAKNKLTGEIPVSLCSLSNLTILDACYNYMSGQIPKCLEVLGDTLIVLNLRKNRFSGLMPWKFTKECSLKTLNLYANQLTGKIPMSLKHCKRLQVLDLGDNQINDTFPFWLGVLPDLRVLILQSNSLRGPIGEPLASNDFPMLQILDLSSNYFTGNLPLDYFAIWKSMRIKLNGSLMYMGSYYYREWMSITSKGQRMDDINILTIFNVLDLSNNLFEGEIPEVIGDLKLLEVLNLSTNNLIGEIPLSLSKLTLLESLDLSKNKLIGEIPMKLLSLTFLSVLNLSYNRLEGKIPIGNQFSTFANDSYEGNIGLCGFPLSKNCDDVEDHQSSGAQRESILSDPISPFSWKFALVGYGCGAPVGVAIGYILFWRTKRCTKWIEQSFKAKKRQKNEQNRRRRRKFK
ncbi:receptor like protein 22-like [Populus nigra]|uniref:receptor like protein 22-like n=1 Tax=Populus nigra TaxID=3691 RepID=UPI002B277CC4|nr:receptor like protein 22-like [Populus nigra]